MFGAEHRGGGSGQAGDAVGELRCLGAQKSLAEAAAAGDKMDFSEDKIGFEVKVDPAFVFDP